MNANSTITLDALLAEMRRLETRKGDEGGMSCREIQSALGYGPDKTNRIITSGVESGMLTVRRCRRMNRVGTPCIVPLYFAVKKKAGK